MSLYGVPTLPPNPRPQVKIAELVRGEGLLMWARSEDGRVFRNQGDGSFHEVVLHELSQRA